MITNQNVTMTQTAHGTLLVVSLQNRSTPGIYNKYGLIRNCEYRIELRGIKKTSKCNVNLWIGDKVRETIYLSKESLPENFPGTIKFNFYNNNRTKFHIGALFDSPNIGDQFQLIHLSVTKIKNKATHSTGKPPNLNSTQQQFTQNILDHVYNKCWKNIYKIIRNCNSNDLTIIWYKIIQHEYKDTFRTYFYYNDKTVKYQNESQFYDVIDYSRKPLVSIINTFKPNAVVEAGAGWGRNLYYLFMKHISTDIDYYGLELTKQGVNTMKSMSKFAPNYTLYSQIFDFNMPKFKIKQKYDKLIMFTMWSIKEITWLNKMFFYLLFDTADKIMGLHLEPIGWQINNKNTAYNHYNRNLYSLLQELESEKRIRIIDIKIDMIGFFSKKNRASLIIWESL